MSTITSSAPAQTNILPDRRSLESLALWLAVVAFITVAIIAIPVFQLKEVPISGPGSIGQYSAIAGGVTGALVYLVGRYVRASTRPKNFLEVIDNIAVALAHGILSLLTWLLISVIFEHSFIDAPVFGIPSIILAGTVAALTAYICFLSAVSMNLNLISAVLAAFLLEGVIASALTASDPHWWTHNLSTLGIPDGISSLAFNVTIIISGIMVVGLARTATAELPARNPQSARIVRILLILIGILLSLVGVFPVSEFLLIHNTVATGMAVLFGVLVVFLPYWIPGMPRPFVLMGWSFLAIIVYLAVLFAIGSYTLTAVELIAGLMIFAWIVLFIRSAAALSEDTIKVQDDLADAVIVDALADEA